MKRLIAKNIVLIGMMLFGEYIFNTAYVAAAQVAAGSNHTVGLKTDGTVVAIGDNRQGQTAVSSWTNIKQVSAGELHTVGLKTDGTVMAVGENNSGQTDVSSWADIKQVSAGHYHTVGLKTDGTVVAVGSNHQGQSDVTSWTNIKQVSARSNNTVGLKTDGTVVAAGNNGQGQTDVSSWTNIKQVSAGDFCTVGLKTDGTVMAVGQNHSGQTDVSSWTDIKQISAGGSHTIGLKTDGTVVAVGLNYVVQSGMSSWTGIKQISAGNCHAVGLKTDGTVVASGNNSWSKCDVSSWDLGHSGILDSPSLTVVTSEADVTLSWTPVLGATGYILFYVAYPYNGIDSIQPIPCGTKTNLSFGLWSGAAYYVAVTAIIGSEVSAYSNVELISIPIKSGDSVSDSVEAGKWKYYTAITTSSDEKISFDMTHLSDNLDMYVRKGSEPTLTEYDCRPLEEDRWSETCSMDNSEETSWYIGVHGNKKGSFNLKTIVGKIDDWSSLTGFRGADTVIRKNIVQAVNSVDGSLSGQSTVDDSLGWLTDIAGGDGQLMRNAIQIYSNWRTNSQYNIGGLPNIRIQMINAFTGSNYDDSHKGLLVDRIIALDPTSAIDDIVQGQSEDEQTLQFLGIQKQCLEWAMTIAHDAGGSDIYYNNADQSVSNARVRPGMGYYNISGGHAMLIVDVKYDNNGNPTKLKVAESNWLPDEWSNPNGQIPWNRTIAVGREVDFGYTIINYDPEGF
jgi:hypothetical protein